MSLEDMYEGATTQTFPRVVEARAQSKGEKSVDFFNNTFAEGFTTRSPGDTVVEQGPGIDKSKFTEDAKGHYETELSSVGESYSEYNRTTKYLENGPLGAPGFNEGLYGQ